MAKTARAARSKAKPAAAIPESAKPSPEETERSLGRWVARGLPLGSVLVALVVGFTTSLGPAILVLAAGALLGTISLLWASVRTLGGDAPLPEDLEALAARRHGVDGLAEHKRRILRALKDLEHEYEVGKIEQADYDEIAAAYREQAKDVMRDMDADIEPLRERAEEIARQHLKKRGLDGAPDDAKEPEETDETQRPSDPSVPAAGASDPGDASVRPECTKCATSNEPDAAFCKKCGATLHDVEATDAP